MILKFVTILAWIFGCTSTAFVLLRVIGYFTYTELDKLKDAMNGQVAKFPIIKPLILAIVCWAWIAST